MKPSLNKITRRSLLKTAAVSTVIASAPYACTSSSAGKLKLGFWDHWVPGANEVHQQLIEEWAKKEKVEVQVDFITSAGKKDQLTAAAEKRAKSGHDMIAMPTWDNVFHADALEPVDEEYKYLIGKYGNLTADGEYIFKRDGTWVALPCSAGANHSYPVVARKDLFKEHAGIDVEAMFPAGPRTSASRALAKNWTWDTFLTAVQKLHKAGFPFGNQLSNGPSDSQDWTGSLFHSFGAIPVDAKGNITIDSDGTRSVLEYMKKLTEVMPRDVYSWDDAGNNKWIISGKGSAIMNPPSAWAVAKRDKPEVAAQLWHFDLPHGPGGHFRPTLPRSAAIWKFSKNKSAAKALLVHLLEREQQEKLVEGSKGYDIPMFKSFGDFKTWETVGPPVGGQYNYPIRGKEQANVGGMPAPPAIAAQIYAQAFMPVMIGKFCQGGESMDEVIKWGIKTLEGYVKDA